MQQPLIFDGPTYNAQRDQVRLSGQSARVFEFMRDGQWHTLAEIVSGIGCASEAGVSARLRDLRKARFGSHTVERQHKENGLHVYRLIERKTQ